ncbi:MAG: 30S ribosomal protein S8 [Patescibacteria group bacterium]
MDQISNMLIMIKNGSSAGKESISFPYSKMKNEIALCLKKEGYVSEVSKKIKNEKPALEIKLIYLSTGLGISNNKNPKITEVQRVSKQSRRVYIGVKEIFPVKNGRGILILSTPKGILSGKEARKQLVGGEALFKMW